MNFAAAQFYLNVAILLINLGLGYYTYRSNKEKVTNARFNELEARMIKVESGVETVKEKVKAMPQCSNHHKMEANDTKLFERLDSLHGDVREMVGSIKGLTNSLDLINQHLLNGGKH